jgi:ABC-2 type transport system permease protein
MTYAQRNSALSDSATMVRRQLRHMLRYPGLTLMLVGMPIVFLLLFVYVFGGALGAGMSGSGGRAQYLAYVAPGIVLMAISAAAQGTAVSVAMDMTEGIVARFKTMAIARVSVLTGHVVGAMIQTIIVVAITLAVAVLIGYRPDAGPLEWLALFGMVAIAGFAFTWLTVACGLWAKSIETASNIPMPLVFLPFLSSGFVPPDSMPGPLRWFAENQPFTPIIDTVRGLLNGTPIGNSAAIAVGWCVVVALIGYVWAKRLFNRER